jgi:formylmethanofuran dehydrogenase subunit C
MRQEGSALLLVIGVVAALAILATTLVMVTANVQGGSAADRTETKAFNVAEAGLDTAIYTLGTAWPADVDSPSLGVDTEAFRLDFSESEYPQPGSGEFLVVDVYDNLSPIDASVHWDSGGPDGTASGGDGIMWIESQAGVGDKSARIRTQVQMQTIGITTLAPGVAVYSGGDGEKGGSGDISSPVVNGQPTGAVYISGEFDEHTSGDLTTVNIYVGAEGDEIPPLEMFMPDSVVQSLVSASKAAQPTATPANTHSGEWRPAEGTYPNPIVVNGDLKITGSGNYVFGSVYVTGDVNISTSGDISFGALYVGGDLDFSGSSDLAWGPVYVDGDISMTGSRNLNTTLIVGNGDIKVTGSGEFAGDGVGTNAKPTTIISVGEDTVVDWAGSGNLYGLLCNMGGDITHTGSGNVHGSEISAGSNWTVTGGGSIFYDDNVINSLQRVAATSAKIVPDTWQEIQPVAGE